MATPNNGVQSRTLQAVLDHSKERVSVHWRVLEDELDDETDWDPYFVSERQLNRLSKELREQLSLLQAVDWTGFEHWTVKRKKEAFGEILEEMANTGTELYGALMTGLQGDRQSEEDSKVFRDWFEETVLPAEEGSWRIQIIHTNYSKDIVPWGLVFTPRSPDDDDRSPTFENYKNFWCSSFRLACRGTFLEEADEIEDRRDGDLTKVAVVIERDVDQYDSFERTRARKPDRDRDLRRDYIAHDKREFRRLAFNQKKNDVFWYISLKSDGGAYSLGGQPLGHQEISSSYEQVNEDRIIIMLIDGDAVIRNDRGSQWVESALEIGRAGLIAVETDIQNPQLRYFGWLLLKSLIKSLSKNPLIDAMQEARREFWPHSLLYGVYCNPLHFYLHDRPDDIIDFIDRFLEIPSVPADETD